MSMRYVFRRPLEMLRELASALSVRHCMVSGYGTDSACSAYVFSTLVPQLFTSICANDFRQVDSMIADLAPYFCDSNGVRLSWSALQSECSARDILPAAVQSPFPAEWLGTRFDMLARMHIVGGGVMTTGLDSYAESQLSYADALSSAVAGATAVEGIKASRCLVFDRVGPWYCASAAPLTVSASAVSPLYTPIWGSPHTVFRLSAFRDTHESFYAGNVVMNGGTMTVTEGVNILNAGTAGTYMFAPPVFPCSTDHAEAGMEEFWDDSAPVLLIY